MLKGIVSGVPTDITRIAMQGKNLFDKSATNTSNGYIQDTMLQSDGTTLAWNVFSVSEYIPIEGGADYYLSDVMNAAFNAPSLCFYDSSKQFLSAITYQARFSFGFSAPSGAAYVRISYMNVQADAVMLNLGSTALPYEPYGMQNGWEVRDQQGTILWGADKTLTGTDSIPFKGYGLPLKSYEIEANMEQAASQQYSITGTDSVTYQSDGTAISLQIVGNETQTGTPTPTVPIQPEETGDRTANLFDKDATPYVTSGYIDENGDVATNSGFNVTDFIAVSAETQYRLTSVNVTSTNPAVCFYDESKQFISGAKYNKNRSLTVTTPEGTAFLKMSYNKNLENAAMLTVGSDPPSEYQPYGYKISITNGNTTYNVYLDEPLRKIRDYADSIDSDGTVTRRIKCIDLGDKTWNKASSGNFNAYLGDGLVFPNSTVCPAYCDIFKAVSTDNYASTSYSFSTYINNESRIVVNKTGFEDMTADDFKTAMLGHKIWYVLATATTEQVIFPTITPTQGSNTLSVNTTLAPSAITLTATSGVWPKNPIEPEEFGDLVTTGEHAGQYKIPIINAGTTYNIFLTEPLREIGDYADSVSSDGTVTRRIKKTVLTGQENWATASSGASTYYQRIIGEYNSVINGEQLCTHFVGATITGATTDVGCYAFNTPSGQVAVINIRPIEVGTTYNTVEKFKTWLSTQYANDTPVCVWYVLSTAITETTTTPTIATTAGTNTLTIGTTLAPSETTITGHIKPIST